MRFFGDSTNTQQNLSLIWVRTCQILVMCTLSISTIGCAKMRDGFVNFFRPERIVPIFDPDATITPQTGTVIYVENGIVVMTVALNDVKKADAFGVLVYNKTNHWISLKKEDCRMLDQAGNIVKQIDESQQSLYFGKNFKPKLPPEFGADVFRYDKTIRIQGGHAVLPTDDYKKTNVMPKNSSLFYLYFPKRSIKSNSLRIIIPGVTSEFNDQQTTFVFKFKVQRG